MILQDLSLANSPNLYDLLLHSSCPIDYVWTKQNLNDFMIQELKYHSWQRYKSLSIFWISSERVQLVILKECLDLGFEDVSLWYNRLMAGYLQHVFALPIDMLYSKSPYTTLNLLSKNLNSRCWHCNHWLASSSLSSFKCRFDDQCQFNLYGSNDMMMRIMPSIVHVRFVQAQPLDHHLGKMNDWDVYFLAPGNEVEEHNCEISECPAYSETQEYHDWKESHNIQVQHSSISL